MSTKVMQEQIADYFKTQPVLKAWLFGSYSRGEQKPWSDVDILVEMDDKEPIGLLKFAGIICDLEDLTGHKIDLVEEGTLKPFAIESVLTKCQTPCEVLFLPKLFVFLKKIVYLQQNVRIHYEQCRLLGFHPFHHC